MKEREKGGGGGGGGGGGDDQIQLRRGNEYKDKGWVEGDQKSISKDGGGELKDRYCWVEMMKNQLAKMADEN